MFKLDGVGFRYFQQGVWSWDSCMLGVWSVD